MRQQQDSDDYEHEDLDYYQDCDEEDLEELGMAVYQGSGLSVRALTAEELQRFLAAHDGQSAQLLGSGWDALQPSTPQPTGGSLRGSQDPFGPAALGWRAPLPSGPRVAPRGGYGSPGHSAQATYRQQRAAELAGWARSAGWRAAAVLAAGVATSVLVQMGDLDRSALPLGLAAAAAAGWRLRFRLSRGTRAWRDGASGERATARLLRRLHRHGYAVFHDVAIPGTPANADHLVIGPPGVVLVDSKRYTGQVTQGWDGRVWHNHYPMDHTLGSLCLETQAISQVLGVQVRPVMCVHNARVPSGGLTAGEVEILPAGRLPSMLRNHRQQLGEAEVAALVAHSLAVLRPAG
jgi:hypothetical protein